MGVNGTPKFLDNSPAGLKHIYAFLKRLAMLSNFHIPLPLAVPFAHS